MTKVLIVDDLEGVRRMLLYALEDDYEVCQAANGLEAIHCAQIERPDIIVMDLDMPVMDGVEATRHIKGHPELSSIKVLAVSGSVRLCCACKSESLPCLEYANLQRRIDSSR